VKPRTLPVVVAALLNIVSCGSRTTPVSARKAGVEIVAPASARDAGASGSIKLPVPTVGNHSTPLKGYTWTPTWKGLPSLLPDREMHSITAVRYVGGETTETVRTKLFELTRRELESPAADIMWSEGNGWSIEATIEFSSGPSLRIFTDGSHNCLLDEAGQPWFFRISPAEFECGFLLPGSTIRRGAATPSCKARGLGVYLQDRPSSPR